MMRNQSTKRRIYRNLKSSFWFNEKMLFITTTKRRERENGLSAVRSK